MSESKQHQNLVKMIVDYISDRVGQELTCLIEYDVMDGHPQPDLTLEGFRPDVCYEHNGILFLGEGKTKYDIERQHSIQQYRSYLKKCAYYAGAAEFILAVPFTEYEVAVDTITRLKAMYPGTYSVKVIQGFV